MRLRVNQLWRETMWLGASSILCRVLGFIPRLFLPRWIGLETIGLYQLCFPFLMFCITLVSGGFPFVIARWIANFPDQKQQIGWIAWQWVFRLGLPFVLIVLCSVPLISQNLYHEPRLLLPLLFVPWIVLVIAMASVYRGFALGLGLLKWSGLTQIAETIFRVFVGTAMTVIAYRFGGVVWGAFALMASVLIGEWIAFRIWRKAIDILPLASPSSEKKQTKFTLRQLAKESLPFVGLRLVGTFAYWLESLWIPYLLVQNGMSMREVLIGIGVIQGTLLPLILMPSAVTNALSSGLYRAVAKSKDVEASTEAKRFFRNAIRISFVLGVTAHVFFIFSADWIGSFVFQHSEYADWFRILLFGSWCVYFQAIFQSVLQASDRAGAAMTNTIVGVLLKMSVIPCLIWFGIEGWNGILYATCMAMIATTMMAAWQCREWFSSK